LKVIYKVHKDSDHKDIEEELERHYAQIDNCNIEGYAVLNRKNIQPDEE
jgi:hypothetical protein